MLAATRIDPRRMWRITSDLLLAFFARHIGGPQAGIDPGLLDDPTATYPETSLGAP